MVNFVLPTIEKGKKMAEYEAECRAFADALKQFQETIDFPISARGWCFPPGALITTPTGMIPIEEVKEGANVLSLKNKVQWNHVAKTYRRDYSGELVEINPYHLLPIRATPEHPIAIVTVKSVIEGGKKKRVPSEIEWVNAGDVPGNSGKVRYAVCYPINRDVVDDERYGQALCTLIGYYLAEGSVFYSDRPNKTPRGVEFALHRGEIEFAKDIESLASMLYGASTTVINREGTSQKRVIVYSAQMARALIEHCGVGAATKSLSSRLMFLPPEKQLLIFDGFHRGDGMTVGKKKTVYTVSKSLALQFQNILLRNNIVCSIYYRTDNGGEEGKYKPLYSVEYTAAARCVGMILGDMLISPIASISRTPYEGPVYDIGVDHAHNFVADGALVHNCYQLEGFHLITKAQFNKVESAINRCREKGYLPIDFVAEEDARKFSGVEEPDQHHPLKEIARYLGAARDAEYLYTPNWWRGEKYYIQMLVEKIDLKTLFTPICEAYHIPIATSKGWSSMLQRAEYARRFKEAEEMGLQCVLLYCGDHDPDGLRISEYIRDNLVQLANIEWSDGTEGYDPGELIIDRFGLNLDFINQHRLSWINNLETGSGKNLADPKHKNHSLSYVQDYIKNIGVRKCEANAMITIPEDARALCRANIEKYLGPDARNRFRQRRQEVIDRFTEERKKIVVNGVSLQDYLKEVVDKVREVLADEADNDEEGDDE